MTPTTRVRPATSNDLDEWLRLRAGLWPECPSAEHLEQIRQVLRGWRAGVSTGALVADIGGRLVGFVEVSIKPVGGRASHPVGYLEGWYVDPEQRRRGIGRLLVDAAVRWARARGAFEIGSACDVSNP